MRSAFIPLVSTLLLTLAGCSGSDLPAATGTGTDTVTGTDTATGTDATTESTTATASASATDASGSASASASGTGGACVPGMSVACACPDGTTGAQTCNPEGSGFDPCECAGSSTTVDPTMGTTGVDPTTTTDPTGATTDPTTTDPTTGTTGALCEDPGPEPNDAQDDSVELGNQGCNAPAESLDGVLDGAGDVDWFTYDGQWGQNCQNNDPQLETTLTADDSARLCVFVECNQGDADFQCQNADSAEAPDGQLGCCSMGQISFTLNCAGTQNESAQVWIRVDQAPEDACLAYTVDYDFNQA